MKSVAIAFGIIFFSVLIFFNSFVLFGKLPIPSDTIVGLYHPFRDVYAKEYPNGIPFKNFLLTDPVRQQYPWRNLVIDTVSKFQLPLWNPYSFSGTPLWANIQSAPLYPGNILFLIFPFSLAWSFLILAQPLFAGIFLYIYLRNLRLNNEASILGAITFAFSGYFIAWLEWGTVLHVAFWLPLILYSVDGIFLYIAKQHYERYRSKLISNALLLLFSLSFAFFAGHIQTFFYLGLFTFCYITARFIQYQKHIRFLFPFGIVGLLFVFLTYFQWYPTLQLIAESGRDIDQGWQQIGWFIPWQHSIQFIAPDFFGNPASLNYWGEWNYAEFIGYVGIIPLVLGLYALFFRRDKKTLFFGTILLFSLLFAFPTPLAKLPYILSFPFISTAQPTRLLFLVDFSLAVLCAFGLDYFLRTKKNLLYPIGSIALLLGFLWIFTFVGQTIAPSVEVENIAIAKRNLIFPTILFALTIGVYLFSRLYKRKNAFFIVAYVCIGITLFDLFRFGTKFTPFTESVYLFPSTKTTEFLQEKSGQFRIMTTDSRMFPPNFSVMYRLQSIEGYDPLYIRRYAEIIAASERKKADISPPLGFNRIITPHNYDSKIIDLLGVQYVLSLSDLQHPKLKKVFQEGETRVYENRQAFPRVFFVSSVKKTVSKEKTIESMFAKDVDFQKQAVVDDPLFQKDKTYTVGKARIVSYSDNKIIIETENSAEGFLVVSDIFYPIWKAVLYTNDSGEKTVPILRTNYIFRGLEIPKGKYTIEMYPTLL